MTATTMTFGQQTISAASSHAGAFRLEMDEWLASPVNFVVWSSFVYQANAIWDKGIRHYSARTIGEVLRHRQSAFSTGDFLCPVQPNELFEFQLAFDLAELCTTRETVFVNLFKRGRKCRQMPIERFFANVFQIRQIYRADVIELKSTFAYCF